MMSHFQIIFRDGASKHDTAGVKVASKHKHTMRPVKVAMKVALLMLNKTLRLPLPAAGSCEQVASTVCEYKKQARRVNPNRRMRMP